CGRYSTSHRNSSPYSDPSASVSTSIARRSRTSAPRSMSGGNASWGSPDLKPIPTMPNGSRLWENGLLSPARRTSWRSGCAAQTDATVLILGETGTGKELVARAVHKRSRRASGAFIRVNCAAIPPSLVASELFGHEKGAFTGAVQRRLGRFEAADGGTIFLDEIGELPPEVQVSLLRVLQERAIERVGSSHPIAVDVRMLAATNRDLEAAVGRGTFREDLFYRLNVFPIRLPPLRERADDIPILVEYLVDRFAKQAGKTIRNIEKQTLQRLTAYDWPGNWRELQDVIERAAVVSVAEG